MHPGMLGFPPGRRLRSETFYANGYFSVPLGVHLVWLTGVAGGGGGGMLLALPTYSINDTFAGGGGAGDEAHHAPVAVIAGSLIPVVIGAGGGNATVGGSTSFGDLLVLAGGEAGTSWNGRGNFSVIDGHMRGGRHNGQSSAAWGRGGCSSWGRGGTLVGPNTGGRPTSNTTGDAAAGYGAGGSGAYALIATYPTQVNGGPGTSGFLTVEWLEDL